MPPEETVEENTQTPPENTPPSDQETTVTSGSEEAGKVVETDQQDEFDVEELIGEDDFVDEPAAPQETPPEQTPPQEEPEQEEAAPAEETPPTQETPKPEETQQAQPQEAPQAPVEEPAPAPSNEELNAQFEAFFEKSVDTLAEKVYAFDEETKEALDTEPSAVLPKLAARLHMQVLTAALTQVSNLIGPMMATENERNTRATQNEDKFFGEFEELRPHKKAVADIARAYRQVNPNTPYEEAAPAIAAIAKVQLKLFDQTPPPEPPATPPVTPTSAQGSTPPPAPAKAQPTEWEELIEEE